MATGGAPFNDSAEELHSWTAPNCSLEDRLNNMVRTSIKHIPKGWLYPYKCFFLGLGCAAEESKSILWEEQEEAICYRGGEPPY